MLQSSLGSHTAKQNFRSAGCLRGDGEVHGPMLAHRGRGRVARRIRPCLALALEDGDLDPREADGDADPVDGNALEVEQNDDE